LLGVQLHTSASKTGAQQMGTEIEPVPAANNAPAGLAMGQDNAQAALFQATLAGVKVEPKTGKPNELWNYKAPGGCLHEDHKDQFHIKNDIQAGCFEAKTSAKYTPFSFSTDNNVSLTGFSAKGTDTTLNGLKPFGLGGEYGLDERAVVLEAGASGSANLATGGKAEAKVGAVVLEGDLRGKAGVYPSRWIDGLCNVMDGKNSDIPAVSDICNEVSKHDYGVAFSGKAGGIVGLAAGGEAHLQLINGRFSIGVSTTLSPGVGSSLGGNIEAGQFDRNE
jgi:hypothetical protein